MEFTKQFFPDVGETLYSGVSQKGLPVFVFPKKGHAETYAVFATHFGSINRQMTFAGDTAETVLPDGIAHFLEHKMFEEPDGTDAFERFSKTGAHANAYTNFDMTAYLFSCTSGFEENLRSLLDFVQTPHYTDKNVQKEQGIIGQEIRMYDDDPEWVCYFNCLQGLYHNHPVRIDIAGTVESIAEITPELLYRCHESFYHPANMVLVVAGDVDPDAVGDIVDEMLRTEGRDPIPQTFPDEPDAVCAHKVEAELAVSMPLFQLGFKDVPESDGRELLRKRLIASLASQLLAGESSELYQELYEKGLLNDIIDGEIMAQPSYFCNLFTAESENPEEVCRRLLLAAQTLPDTPTFGADFARAKKNAYGSFIKLFNHVDNVASQQRRFYFEGISLSDYLPVLQSVTAEDVANYLKENLTADRAVLSVVRPKKEA